MAQFFSIHPDNPQPRLIGQAAAILRGGGVAAYPTDSCYALGCLPGDKAAVERIIRIRRLDPGHHLTLLCRDLSEIGVMARLDNRAFRLLKKLTPGPYTFLLRASRDVPRRLQHAASRTIGIRVPDNTITLALLEALGEPLLSTSLILPGQEHPETEAREIDRTLGTRIDLIIEGGVTGMEQTTVVDLSGDTPVIVREGKGDIAGIIG
ncbi:MAG: L-threonylcarbamoyladenylate synthase [Gammaproteobacteria bacterium]|jgi:tRNA threonylcarbamoyl adenosine modification protein (Sua5/YciO/YrdC/YwlC family)